MGRVSCRLIHAGGGAHARGGFAAAKSGGAPEVGAADKVHRRPRAPHRHHVSAPGVEAQGLGIAGDAGERGKQASKLAPLVETGSKPAAPETV